MQFLILTLFWLAGLAVGQMTTWSLVVWGIILGAAMLVGVVVRRQPRYLFAAACLAFLAAGAGRYILAQPSIDESHIAFYNEQEVTIIGRVIDEPDIRDRSVNLRIAVEQVTADAQIIDEISGEMLLQTSRFPIYEYGTRLAFTGRLETPPESESFSYRDYLARQGIYSMMTWPRVSLLEENVGNPIYHTIYEWKGRAQEAINTLIPEPQAGLLSGILLGVGHAMSPDLERDFRINWDHTHNSGHLRIQCCSNIRYLRPFG